MIIVGIDLAGVESRPTGFCLLQDSTVQTNLLYSDKEIIEKTAQSYPAVIAIDAPLYLPLGRKTLEELDTPHMRQSDRELLKMGIKIFPVTLGPMRKLTLRGIMLRKAFQAQGYKVIETYPGGAQDILGIPRKQKGVEKLRCGLEKLGINGLSSKMSDHELDAATCSYVGKLFLDGESITYGLPNQGIVMPKGTPIH